MASVSDTARWCEKERLFEFTRDSRRRERGEKRERFETEFTRTEQTHKRTYHVENVSSTEGYQDAAKAKKAREEGGLGTHDRKSGFENARARNRGGGCGRSFFVVVFEKIRRGE